MRLDFLGGGREREWKDRMGFDINGPSCTKTYAVGFDRCMVKKHTLV